MFRPVRELADVWDGVLWNNPAPTDGEPQIVESLTGRTCTYCRVGYDQRLLTFDGQGMAGAGAAECERRWSINNADGHDILTIG